MHTSTDTAATGARPVPRTPPVVSLAEWQSAHQQMLAKEKALTRARDALAAERRRMPWLAVAKEYSFDGPEGKATLLDLFKGRRQLVVYRAFFEPGVYGWPEHACRGCSFGADQVSPPRPSERPRHDARVRIARAASRHRSPESTNGLEDAVVHAHRRLRRRLRRRPVARHERVLPRRRLGCFAPTSSTRAATRRWARRGATSTRHRSGARRRGRTRPRATRRRRPTTGGAGTTSTRHKPRPISAGSRSRRPARCGRIPSRTSRGPCRRPRRRASPPGRRGRSTRTAPPRSW